MSAAGVEGTGSAEELTAVDKSGIDLGVTNDVELVSSVVVLNYELKIPSIGECVTGHRVVYECHNSVCIGAVFCIRGRTGILVEYLSPSVHIVVGPVAVKCVLLEILGVRCFLLGVVKGLVVPYNAGCVEHRKVDVARYVVELLVEGGVVYDRLVPAGKLKVEVGEEAGIKQVGGVVSDVGGGGGVTEVSRNVIVMSSGVDVGLNHVVETRGVLAVVVTVGSYGLPNDLNVELFLNGFVSHSDSLVKLVLGGFLLPLSGVMYIVTEEDSDLCAVEVKLALGKA